MYYNNCTFISILTYKNLSLSQVKSRFFDLPSAVFSTSICPSKKWAGLIAATSGEQVFLLVTDQQETNHS